MAWIRADHGWIHRFLAGNGIYVIAPNFLNILQFCLCKSIHWELTELCLCQVWSHWAQICLIESDRFCWTGMLKHSVMNSPPSPVVPLSFSPYLLHHASFLLVSSILAIYSSISSSRASRFYSCYPFFNLFIPRFSHLLSLTHERFSWLIPYLWLILFGPMIYS